jgi:hypothetical protein
MTYVYHCEFVAGVRAKLTVTAASVGIEWDPRPPHTLRGQARRRFLASYRAWRDASIADFAKKSGVEVAVLEVWLTRDPPTGLQ